MSQRTASSGLCIITNGCICTLWPRLIRVRVLMSALLMGDHAMAHFVLDATAVKHIIRPACDSRRIRLWIRRVGFDGTKRVASGHVMVSLIVSVLRRGSSCVCGECLRNLTVSPSSRKSHLLPPLYSRGESAQQSRKATENVTVVLLVRGKARSWRASAPLVDVGCCSWKFTIEGAQFPSVLHPKKSSSYVRYM